MQGAPTFRFPKPGKALAWAMIVLGCLWVLFAVGLNWGGAGQGVLAPFVGSSEAVLRGEIWRLLTAALLHHPNSIGHIFTTLLGLYFLGHTLEERWGGQRFLLFLALSAIFAFLMQTIIGSLVPKLDTPIWYGGLGMVEAVAVAWALSHRNQHVRLFFVLPVTGNMLLVFVFVMSVLNVIAAQSPAEGLVTPFGGMAAGWLFGEGGPLRRVWLKWRFEQLKRQSTALRDAPTSSPRRRSGLRVIEGGKRDDKKIDKRFLN